VTGFIGTVSLELVDNSGGGACTGLPNIATLPNQTFVALDNGRHAISPAMSVIECLPQCRDAHHVGLARRHQLLRR